MIHMHKIATLRSLGNLSVNLLFRTCQLVEAAHIPSKGWDVMNSHYDYYGTRRLPNKVIVHKLRIDITVCRNDVP